MDLAQVEPSYVVGAVALAALSYVVYQRWFSALAPIPGPFFASISSLWIAHAYWRGDFHRYVIELHRKYGPIVRVAPDGVSISDVDAIKVIYGSGSKFWKGKWYKDLTPPSSFNLLSMTDEKRHKRHRHLVEPIYALKSIRESEELMEKPMRVFVEQTKQRKGEAFDIVDSMNMFAVDIFTGFIYGERYGLSENGQFPLMLAFVEWNWQNYFWMAMLPPLGKFQKLLQKASIIVNVILSGGKPPLPILSWTTEKVNQAMAGEKDRNAAPSILEKFVELHRSNPVEFPKEALDASMFESVFAGFETCGATMPKIIWRIVTTDGCQARLQKELDAIKMNSKLPGCLTYDELRKLPYLSACMSEGSRIEPITGTILSRSVPSGGVEMNGYFLPGGTEIGIHPWVVSYNEEIMENPFEFNPERWLNASKELKMKMDQMDLMFSAGPSSCPGKVMAQALMYKAISVIFSNFNVTPLNPNQDIKEVAMFPVKWRDVKMKLSPRE